MWEVGKDFAKDMAKSVACEVSQFAADLLNLEEWAKSTIGIDIAKLVTGIDPKKEASELRGEAENICDGLWSWVDHSAAYNQGRQPPDTLVLPKRHAEDVRRHRGGGGVQRRRR